MPIIEITDFSDPALDVYARLTEAQLLNREDLQNSMFIAESPNVIQRALAGGCVPVSMLMEHRHLAVHARDIMEKHPEVPVYTADLEVLTQLTGFPLTRGILCAMHRPADRQPEDICRNARRIAVLENVVNPTNVGAIFRSAAGLNMDAVLLTPDCCDPLYRRSVRVSMGTVFQIPWAYIGEKVLDWPHPGMERLRSMGFKTVAMALRNDSVAIDDPILRAEPKLAIILGTEGEGMKAETMALCDYTVKIPMTHNVDSLNVAAASAVAFWELSKCE